MTKSDEKKILAGFRVLGRVVHQNAIRKGFWDDKENPLKTPTMIALMHGELSEAVEWHREGNGVSNHLPKFSGVEEEMADAVIRESDFCEAFGHRLGKAIVAKVKFNAGRPFMHGKKL